MWQAGYLLRLTSIQSTRQHEVEKQLRRMRSRIDIANWWNLLVRFVIVFCCTAPVWRPHPLVIFGDVENAPNAEEKTMRTNMFARA
jgi:hypothetical protein